MSEPSSEYLKRTCLICGCHTNQTINIYEPRSGPNIVQLIQAKFKFQPLNEDKYLCFSCNNWLINWHSLQALNSNEAESPGGTFRSHPPSQMNDQAAGGGGGAAPQGGQCRAAPSGGRPVAMVRPRQQQQQPATAAASESLALINQGGAPVPPSTRADANETLPALAMPNPALDDDVIGGAGDSPPPRRIRCSFSKCGFRLRRLQRPAAPSHKRLQACSECSRAVIVRTRHPANAAQQPAQQPPQQQQRRQAAALNATVAPPAKCRKCREVGKWRSLLAKAERSLAVLAQPTHRPHSRALAQQQQRRSGGGARRLRRLPPAQSLVSSLRQGRSMRQSLAAAAAVNASASSYHQPGGHLGGVGEAVVSAASAAADAQALHYHQRQQQQRLPRPSVDGKVVAMLRRLGTTLSREQREGAQQLPLIMGEVRRAAAAASPWTRQLDDDEILLDFNTAISEVLPRLATPVEELEEELDDNEEEEEEATPELENWASRRSAPYRMSAGERLCGDDHDWLQLEPAADEEEEEGEGNAGLAATAGQELQALNEEVPENRSSPSQQDLCSSQTPPHSVLAALPKGLTVSLI